MVEELVMDGDALVGCMTVLDVNTKVEDILDEKRDGRLDDKVDVAWEAIDVKPGLDV